MLNKENAELHKKLMDQYKDKMIEEVKNPSEEQKKYEQWLIEKIKKENRLANSSL